MPMPHFSRRWAMLTLVALGALFILYFHPPSKPAALPFSNAFTSHQPWSRPASGTTDAYRPLPPINTKPYTPKPPTNSIWRLRPQLNPVATFEQLPTGPSVRRPRVQADFPPETDAEKETRHARLDAVRAAFKHTWDGYKRYAWGRDELMPLSNEARDPFGGWAATLVDALDTIWLMGLQEEWNDAITVVRTLDFSTSSVLRINIFETTIRFLGGFLGAYDLSGEKVLLDKAAELGELLYAAFDTPNRIPNTRWDWQAGLAGEPFDAGRTVVSAEIGSMSLEFTRLTQLTGDPKYYDAIARITTLFETQQNRSNIPGLWPVFVNPAYDDVSSGNMYSLGAMADSLYEYLPKTWALLGGRVDSYKTMYDNMLRAAKKHLFYRALNPWKPGELMAAGDAISDDAGHGQSDPRTQHLSCFVGGMVALGAKLFDTPGDLALARQLTDGCIYAYQATATGIAPEIFSFVPCDAAATAPADTCAWSEARWHAALAQPFGTVEVGFGMIDAPPLPHSRDEPAPASSAAADGATSNGAASDVANGAATAAQLRLPPGFSQVQDRKYQLRPEALESVFVLYRVTGDATLREQGWAMFESIGRATKTAAGFAGLDDVTDRTSAKRDRMESFWLGETLKYAWLLFADHDVLSLDEWVVNTEAHPLRLPV